MNTLKTVLAVIVSSMMFSAFAIADHHGGGYNKKNQGDYQSGSYKKDSYGEKQGYTGKKKGQWSDKGHGENSGETGGKAKSADDFFAQQKKNGN